MPDQPALWPADTTTHAQPLDAIPPASDGTPAEEWLGGVHPDGQLEVTKGYHIYPDKLSRMLSYLAEEREPEGSVYEQLMGATGLVHARVEALVQCMTRMELVVPRALTVTPLGHLILSHDPFFDRTGTLWLLHYLFASNPSLVVWNYLCNAVLPSVPEISLSDAIDQFLPFSGRWSEYSIRKKTRKELNAFFSAYTTDLFARLHYLRPKEDNVYGVNRDVMPAPAAIFHATMLVYRDRYLPGATSVEIPTLAYADHSPGRLMRQDELRIRRLLDELHESGQLTVESKANLDQVRFKQGTEWLDAVQRYYEALHE